MVNLQAVTPCQDLLPLTIGTVSFTEISLPEGKVWSVSPCPVEPNTSKRSKTSQTIWIGRDHGLQISGEKPRSGETTDQSDAWACVAVQGVDAIAVLARLCPVDMSKLSVGQVVRSLVNHIPAIIIATSFGFQVLVFRGYAGTLVEELTEVATQIDGRNQLER